MTYMFTGYRKIDNVIQTIIVKRYGGTGNKFSQLRNYAGLVTGLDAEGQHGSGSISASYLTQENLISRDAIRKVSCRCVTTNTEGNPVDSDSPRSCVFTVDDTTYEDLVDDIKSKYSEITGKTWGADVKTYLTNLIINLYT